MLIVFCSFKQSKLNELQAFQPAHFSYLKSIDKIEYGGVLLTEDYLYSGIMYSLSNKTRAEAEEIIKNDPYSHLYSSHQIHNFEQKIPNT